VKRLTTRANNSNPPARAAIAFVRIFEKSGLFFIGLILPKVAGQRPPCSVLLVGLSIQVYLPGHFINAIFLPSITFFIILIILKLAPVLKSYPEIPAGKGSPRNMVSSSGCAKNTGVLSLSLSIRLAIQRVSQALLIRYKNILVKQNAPFLRI